MDEQDIFLCLCGRSFVQEFAYGKHQRFCQKSKKRLSGVLNKAKELWHVKKQRRLRLDSTGGPSHSEGSIPEMAVDNPGTMTDTRPPGISSNMEEGGAMSRSSGEQVYFFPVLLQPSEK
jgi:hypothetical protein